MAANLRGRRGPDLQIIAMAIVAFGLILSRVVMAQRLGIDLGDVSEFARGVERGLYLRPIPDLLFAALALALPWIRFR